MSEAEQKAVNSGQTNVENRDVRDPVTGGQVIIRDATENPEEVPLGKNVLRIPFPPPDLQNQRDYLLSLFNTTVSRMTLAFAIVPILAFSISPPALTSRPLFLLIPSLGIPAALSFLWMHRMQSKSEDDADRHAWEVERQRGLQAGYDITGDGKISAEEKIKESAEWLNVLLKGLWPIINPDMFTSTVDMLEDIMQASVPAFIHSVRIPDLGLGNNPLRITSLRALPDAELDGVTEPLDKEEQEAITGEHVNFELGFAYRAAPNRNQWSEKAENFHLLVEFYLGIKGVAAVPIPVWAEITGIVGTARMRLELIPDPPFIKRTLITLVGLPKVSISITPIHKRLIPNVMDIPFISRFITQSINAAAQEYVAPKSLMLDLQQLLSGDGLNRDTAHIGVIVVHIHRVSVSKEVKPSVRDLNAFINICLSPMNKTQYTTRIISGTLEPIFEETAILLVDANAAKIGEKISLQLWDDDRFTADDIIGRLEVDVSELMSKHNEATRKVAPMRVPLSDKEAGTIEYTMGFFSKLAPGSTNSATKVPPEILEKESFKKARQSTLTDLEAAVAVTPPPDDFVSGIFGIQLHEIRELGVMTDNMTLQHSGKGSSLKPEGEQENESDKGLPSSYCIVMINDEPVYRTRTKPMTSTPFFNSTTEKFIRDWKATHICVVVRDSRMRENDPILGMVMFKLSDLFRNRSMTTGSWSLQHGIGFGRIHLSFVFRPVRLTMPPSLVGFDTGTVQVKNINLNLYDKSLQENVEVRLSTTGAYSKIKKGVTEKEDSSDDDDGAESNTLVHLPIQTRYRSALVINVKPKGIFKRGTIAMGTIWLRDLVDNHDDEVVLAKLWKVDDFNHMKQNYAKPEESAIGDKAEAIGEVELKVVFKPGIADVHEKDMKEDPKKQKSWEEYTIMKREGLRHNIGRNGSALEITDSGESVLFAKTEQFSPTTVDSIPMEQDSSQASLNEKLKDWTTHQDNLSAKHRGIKQFKGVRTAEWMADGFKNVMMGMTRRGSKKGAHSKMEKEA